MYAICKNGDCAQTYHVEEIMNGRSGDEFMESIKSTKGYRCEKCSDVVIDVDGQGSFSNNPYVIKYITVEKLEEERKEQLKAAREKLVAAQKEVEELENDLY